MFSAASDNSLFSLGEGTNMIWVDPENDLVIVVRCIQKETIGEFIENVMQALLAG